MTLYGAIIFWIGYWSYFQWFRIGLDGPQEVAQAMVQIEAIKLASAPATDDASLWKMSRNAQTVAAGRQVYDSICFTCHGPTMAGIKGVGFRLDDDLWVHGNTPMAVFRNISEGIAFEGKPTGMASQKALGTERLAAVTAYLLSLQKEGGMKVIPRSQEPSQHTP